MGTVDDSVRGRWIYAAWKHLRRYDATAVGLMGATALAGKAGDLLGRLRMLASYDHANLVTLALDAGISKFELDTLVIPRLESSGALQVRRDQANQIAGVIPLVLGETDVLEHVATVWDTLDATPEEAGALEVLRACSEIPRTHDELLERCATADLDEEQSERAVERAVSVALVKRRHVAEAGLDLYFNEYCGATASPGPPMRSPGSPRPSRSRWSQCWPRCTRTRAVLSSRSNQLRPNRPVRRRERRDRADADRHYRRPPGEFLLHAEAARIWRGQGGSPGSPRATRCSRVRS